MKISIFCISLLLLVNYKLIHASDFNLNYFLKEVEQVNLDLKVEDAKNASEKSKAMGVRIPAPSVSYLQRNFEYESAKGFEISQTIPYPGKISSEKRVREESSVVANYTYKLKMIEILSLAKLTFIEYWIQYEYINILKDKHKVISGHIQLTRSVVRSNSLMKIHLLKAQTDLNLLENEIFKQEQILFEKKLLIAELLNKPAKYTPSKPIEPPLSEIKTIDVANSMQIKTLETKLLVALANESDNKKSWFPDLKLSYMELSKTSMMPEHSQISVGITLPFAFPWEANSKSSEASALRRVSEYQLEKGKRSVEYTQARLLEESKSIKKQLSLINSQLLPRARESMKLVNNIAPRDQSSLQDHREAMEAFTDIRLQALYLRQRYEQVVSELLKFSISKEDIYE